jgi:aconitate hydratase
MSPEYGATIAVFPIDAMTIDYLRLSGRDAERIELVETYARAQGLYRDKNSADPVYTETIDVDLGAIEASLAGPKRPQDRVPLKGAKQGFAQALPGMMVAKHGGAAGGTAVAAPPQAAVEHGSVVIAAITSCTNTSNPSVMIGAGLVAKRAVEKGLTRKPWVKTSLAPGSKVVTSYLKQAGLDTYLDALGFNLVGYGCTTCIGNSGPLPEDVSAAIDADGLVVASVLSGNRNFEGRVQQQVRANYLASPPLVVAYALAGTMNLDLTTEPLGTGKDGKPVFLKDIWPTERELQETMLTAVKAEQFEKEYADVFQGDELWQKLDVPTGNVFAWQNDSTYVRNPPFLESVTLNPAPLENISGARVLALLGDSITTDHISPAGSIKKDSPAGKYLIAHGVQPADFNSYGARRGNHEVMMRGTFANTRLRNQIAPGTEGGVTTYLPGADVMPIYDAAMKYKEAGVPLIVIAGKEYGSGSSRDWAAKGTLLLGVKAVIAESFERIHRSNLVNMGVLPLQFQSGQSAASIGLTGRELYSIGGIDDGLKAGALLTVRAQEAGNGTAKKVEFKALVRIDTPEELVSFKHGGILPYVLRQLVGK